MNINKVIILFLIMFSFVQGMSQEISLSQAIDHYQKKELNQSKRIIDILADDNEVTADPNYWYLKGFVYKDLYKAEPKADSAINYRKISLHSFRKLESITDMEQYLNDAQKNITFIATTFYNDAIELINENKIDEAEMLYDLYKTSIATIEAVTSEKEITFYLAMATRATHLSKSDSTAGDEYFNKAEGIYERVLALDTNNIKANYNLAVLYYNKAVDLISDLDVDEIDLISFSEIEDRSINLFKQSLPYMQHAYHLDPEDKNTIEGLAGIYFSLRDFEKSEEYKKMIE